MHDPRPPRLATPFPVAIATIMAAMTLVACGSSSPPHPATLTGAGAMAQTGLSTRSTSGTSAATSSRLAFSRCMRANGVPNFPDQGSGGIETEGNAQTLTVNGITVSAPAYRAARGKCQKYMPHQTANPVQEAQARAGALRFARCMRRHGVPNFPDPKFFSGHDGNQVVYLPGINPKAPAFEAAAKACGGGPKGP